MTEDVAHTGGRFTRRYRRSHSGIDAVDYLIAAAAIVIDADLLTTNVRHTRLVDALIEELLASFPAVLVVGPRACGRRFAPGAEELLDYRISAIRPRR